MAATLYWTVTEAQLAGQSADMPLLDKDRNVVARLPAQQLRTLLTVKEKIASAAGQYGVVLAVSNDDAANAFAGRQNGRATVIFTIPMLNRLGDDEQLVAAIMAHEFGHLNYNHTGRSERRAASTAIGMIAGIAAGLFIPGPLASTLAANAVDLTGKALIHSYDRDQEREADAYGVDIMAKAGYDPQAAVRLWSSRGDMSSGGLFSTHPATDERLANVQRIVAARAASPQPRTADVAAARVQSPEPSAASASVAVNVAAAQPETPPSLTALQGPPAGKNYQYEHCIVADARVECGYINFAECERARRVWPTTWPPGSSCVQKAELRSQSPTSETDESARQTLVPPAATTSLPTARESIQQQKSLAKPGSAAQRLRVLDDLFKQGLITEAEYAEKRKEILSAL